MTDTDDLPIEEEKLEEKVLPVPPQTLEDRAHEVELKFAETIRVEIIALAERLGEDIIAGKLGLSNIALTALLSRKHWTLRFAIVTALKLNLDLYIDVLPGVE